MKVIYVYPESSWIHEKEKLSEFNEDELKLIEQAYTSVRKRVDKSVSHGGGIRLSQSLTFNGRAVKLIAQKKKPSVFERLFTFLGMGRDR